MYYRLTSGIYLQFVCKSLLIQLKNHSKKYSIQLNFNFFLVKKKQDDEI